MVDHALRPVSTCYERLTKARATLLTVGPRCELAPGEGDTIAAYTRSVRAGRKCLTRTAQQHTSTSRGKRMTKSTHLHALTPPTATQPDMVNPACGGSAE